MISQIILLAVVIVLGVAYLRVKKRLKVYEIIDGLPKYERQIHKLHLHYNITSYDKMKMQNSLYVEGVIREMFWKELRKHIQIVMFRNDVFPEEDCIEVRLDILERPKPDNAIDFNWQPDSNTPLLRP